MTVVTGTGFVPSLSRLDALASRMANAIVAGTYSSAREAARVNVVEYAQKETNDADELDTQIGNFARKITNTLNSMGYDKTGNVLELPK